MKIMYMDESGKNILSEREPIFIFGGLIVEKSNVFTALKNFKKVHDTYKKRLQETVGKNLLDDDGSGQTKNDRMHKMFDHFEFHAVQIFKSWLDTTVRQGEVKSENPWKYYPKDQIPIAVVEVLKSASDYIEKVFMFKVRNDDYKQYYYVNGNQTSDNQLNEEMVEFILHHYNQWLIGQEAQGVLVPDTLDKKMRGKFVYVLYHQFQNEAIWTEPIPVESHTNAFTQIIDLMTYCYRVVTLNETDRNNFESIKKIYTKYIKDHILELDLVDYLKSKEKVIGLTT
jgi:hypothetical protein